ncbi:AAA family ATPase [Pararhizobium sp. A13]|uniref:AAA family ATPase n=1 Tax=Pararhizobium sp. A13 TaxID=3133975 RepID=UPI003250A702
MVEIRQLRIDRFRGIRGLVWNPSPGLNLIIGGGDTGKTTILDAISLLFQPSNSASLTEADYWQRKTEDGFRIEAVIAIPDELDLTSTTKTLWPWEWDGKDAVQPRNDAKVTQAGQYPVFRVAVSASADFDLAWEIIQPDEAREYFSLGLRRRIGLIKLGSEEKNDRDLRLVHGSGLDRLLSEENLRAKIGKLVSQVPLVDQLGEDATKAIAGLSDALDKAALPSDISLGLTGSQGISIGALIGLTARKEEVFLPLSSWGAGTRRMASLQVAASVRKEAELIVIDEIERGLEPYRLRQLVSVLIDSGRQGFITTHSPIALFMLGDGQLWFFDAEGMLGKLDHQKIGAQVKRDPVIFLSRVPVLVEGETERGFVHAILKRLLQDEPDYFGVRVSVGKGDAQLLDLLVELKNSNLNVCGFADNDGGKKDRWAALKGVMGDRLFQWKDGCIETNLIPLVPAGNLESLFRDEEGDWDGYRLRSVATRLEIADKEFEALLAAVDGDREMLRSFIIKAATGDADDIKEHDPEKRKSIAKEWKKQSRSWFKKEDGSGGRELVRHIVQNDAWEQIEPMLRPFFNSVLVLVGKSPSAKIDL